MLPYEFHPLAEQELAEEVRHYESLQPGKGIELLGQMSKAIEQIRLHPESAPKTLGLIRSIVIQPSSRWEFIMHYRAKPNRIRILAVAHQKRQPFYWFGRR